MIGDDFLRNLAGVSASVTVQPCGRVSAWDLRSRIKKGEVDLNYDVVVLLVGGFQLMSHSAVQIAEGVEGLLLTLRNKIPGTWILVSTLLYRPRDETLSKIKIDRVNKLLRDVVQKLSLVGCKCVLVRAHNALVSPVDNKLLRPIHVYYEDGLIPSRQAAYLLVRFFIVCALEVYGPSG